MVRFSKTLIGPAILLVILGLPSVVGRGPARAQTAGCTQPAGQEPSGPTDVSAVSGNQELTVALNPDATVTAFKWPSPSYYDQIKYRTTDRSLPFLGAQPNEGAFIGLAFKPRAKGDGWDFAWLREWKSEQRFADDDSDVVVTTFRNSKHGLSARVSDVVGKNTTTLQREIRVTRTNSSAVRRVRIFAFANFNPVYSKIRNQPVADWCTEESNDGGASFVRKDQVVVHVRSGTDQSTTQSSSAAVAFGFDEHSDGHEVGEDTYEAGAGLSAYDDAADGTLSGSGSATGQADAALFVERKLNGHRWTKVRVVMAAGATQNAALKAFRKTSERSSKEIRIAKAGWWSDWLDSALLPKNAPAAVTQLSKRALISLRQATDPIDGLIVTSIATQPPLALDWVRHGAYINQALEAAGHPEMVLKHNQRYASLQATATSKPLGGETTPAGNWSQNFYADGVVAGPIPYEIDATGFGIWALWEHARFEDTDYLDTGPVYEAIQLAAHYLSDNPQMLGCRDPATGLQCAANEEDNPNPSQTLVGAQAAWLGLGAAIEAAIQRDTPDSNVNAAKWEARREELKTAIDTNFFAEDCTCYTTDYEVGGTLLWPVGFLEENAELAQAQADVNFEHMAAAMIGEVTTGGMEARALLGNAHAWSAAPDIAHLKDALLWIARNTTTDGTGLLGSAWMLYPPGSDEAEIIAMEGQPHNFHGAMFYLAALEVYGAER